MPVFPKTGGELQKRTAKERPRTNHSYLVSVEQIRILEPLMESEFGTDPRILALRRRYFEMNRIMVEELEENEGASLWWCALAARHTAKAHWTPDVIRIGPGADASEASPDALAMALHEDEDYVSPKELAKVRRAFRSLWAYYHSRGMA